MIYRDVVLRRPASLRFKICTGQSATAETV